MTLLQRWKLGRGKGVFCSREHEDAHTDLQAQAARRLMGADAVEDLPEPETAGAQNGEWKLETLAPPVMAVEPRDMRRPVMATVHAAPGRLRIARPVLKWADARFAPADDAAGRIMPAANGRTVAIDPFAADPSFEAPSFDAQGPFLSARSSAPSNPAPRPATVRMRVLPDPIVSEVRLNPPLPLAQVKTPVRFPTHAIEISGGNIQRAGRLRIDVAASGGHIAIRSNILSLSASPSEPRVDLSIVRGAQHLDHTGPLPIEITPSPGQVEIRSRISNLDAVLSELQIDRSIGCGAPQLEASREIEHREWVRPAPPPRSALIPQEVSLASHGIPLRLPLDGVDIPGLVLSGADATEMPRPGSVHGNVGIQTLEPSPCWRTTENLQLPRTAPAVPQLRWCVRRVANLGAAGSEGAARLRQVAGVRELAVISKTVYPLLASAVDPALASVAIPEFMLHHLVGPPAGPGAGDCIVTLSTRLLALKRGAAGESPDGSLPAFKGIPMQAMRGAGEPIFSFEAISLEISRTKRVTPFAKKHPRTAVAGAPDGRIAWRT